ncbi:hypothetical protein AB0E21_05090 [Streptomyces sp. NPDC047967]|uniref:hypothetical protein n=1 Tax=Streptomyces sp. NPDC047967 TaxID=3154924 RepID=UPI0033F95939
MFLEEEEKQCLGRMWRGDRTMISGFGVKLPTVEALEGKGLVDLHVHSSRRKWAAVLNERGLTLAPQFSDYRTGVSVDRGEATRAVMVELCKQRPEKGPLDEAWHSLSLERLELFTRDAKRWLSDRSELPTRVINAAQYADLLNSFRESENLPPIGVGAEVREVERVPEKEAPQGKKPAAVKKVAAKKAPAKRAPAKKTAAGAAKSEPVKRAAKRVSAKSADAEKPQEPETLKPQRGVMVLGEDGLHRLPCLTAANGLLGWTVYDSPTGKPLRNEWI